MIYTYFSLDIHKTQYEHRYDGIVIPDIMALFKHIMTLSSRHVLTGTRVTKGLWAHNWNFVKIIFASIMIPIRSCRVFLVCLCLFVLHRPPHLSCCGMCKIVKWSDHYFSWNSNASLDYELINPSWRWIRGLSPVPLQDYALTFAQTTNIHNVHSPANEGIEPAILDDAATADTVLCTGRLALCVQMFLCNNDV